MPKRRADGSNPNPDNNPNAAEGEDEPEEVPEKQPVSFIPQNEPGTGNRFTSNNRVIRKAKRVLKPPGGRKEGPSPFKKFSGFSSYFPNAKKNSNPLLHSTGENIQGIFSSCAPFQGFPFSTSGNNNNMLFRPTVESSPVGSITFPQNSGFPLFPSDMNANISSPCLCPVVESSSVGSSTLPHNSGFLSFTSYRNTNNSSSSALDTLQDVDMESIPELPSRSPLFSILSPFSTKNNNSSSCMATSSTTENAAKRPCFISHAEINSKDTISVLPAPKQEAEETSMFVFTTETNDCETPKTKPDEDVHKDQKDASGHDAMGSGVWSATLSRDSVFKSFSKGQGTEYFPAPKENTNETPIFQVMTNGEDIYHSVISPPKKDISETPMSLEETHNKDFTRSAIFTSKTDADKTKNNSNPDEEMDKDEEDASGDATGSGVSPTTLSRDSVFKSFSKGRGTEYFPAPKENTNETPIFQVMTNGEDIYHSVISSAKKDVDETSMSLEEIHTKDVTRSAIFTSKTDANGILNNTNPYEEMNKDETDASCDVTGSGVSPTTLSRDSVFKSFYKDRGTEYFPAYKKNEDETPMSQEMNNSKDICHSVISSDKKDVDEIPMSQEETHSMDITRSTILTFKTGADTPNNANPDEEMDKEENRPSGDASESGVLLKTLLRNSVRNFFCESQGTEYFPAPHENTDETPMFQAMTNSKDICHSVIATPKKDVDETPMSQEDTLTKDITRSAIFTSKTDSDEIPNNTNPYEEMDKDENGASGDATGANLSRDSVLKWHHEGRAVEYCDEVKRLNQSVLDYIELHLSNDGIFDLTPVFKEYEQHLESIKEKYPIQTHTTTLNAETGVFTADDGSLFTFGESFCPARS